MSNTYTNNPQGGNTLAADQPRITANFAYLIQTLGKNQPNKAGGTGIGDHSIQYNHTDATAFEGRHLQVSLFNRTGSPAVVSGINDSTNVSLYADDGELYMSSLSNDGPYQLTTVNTSAPSSDYTYFATNTNYGSASGMQFNGGWTFLPGGLILQYGYVTSLLGYGSSPFNIPFPITFLNDVFTVTVSTTRSPFSNNVDTVYVQNFGAGFGHLDYFRVGNTSSSAPATGLNELQWMAIGN